jgi:hypothetical protein
MDNGSPKYSLNKEDGKRILLGAGIAVAGALLTYLTSVVTGMDFGQYTPMVVAIWAVLANTARKFLTDYTK